MVSGNRRLRSQRAQELQISDDRLLLFAVANMVDDLQTARLVIEQDGFNHRLHIAAHAGAVVGKLLRHPIDVACAGIGSNEPLDQLARDERGRILMIEDDVQSGREIALAIQTGGNVLPQHVFRTGVVVAREVRHRVRPLRLEIDRAVASQKLSIIDYRIARSLRSIGLAEAPSREDAGKVGDVRIGVGLAGCPVRIKLQRAVRKAVDQADREKLHHLAGIVLIGADEHLSGLTIDHGLLILRARRGICPSSGFCSHPRAGCGNCRSRRRRVDRSNARCRSGGCALPKADRKSRATHSGQTPRAGGADRARA